MKKKIILSVFCCLSVLLIMTGCNKENNSVDESVKNTFENIYSIELEDKAYEESSSEYIRKMKADDMDFYVYTYNHGNGLNVVFNFSANNYEIKDYFDDCNSCEGHFITINATSSQSDLLLSFVNDVLSINEIKNLYDIWLKNDNYEYFVYDYTEIIIDGNDYFPQSIFDYYKSN